MSKLLSDEELEAAIRNEYSEYELGMVDAGIDHSKVNYDILETKRLEAWNRLEQLIKEQKQAHGDMVIGENQAGEDNIYPTEEGKHLWLSQEHEKAVRNGLRNEQRQRNSL